MTVKEQIRELIEFNPALTNIEIADVLNVTRSLVSYHARTMTVPRRTKNRSCAGCGIRIKTTSKTGMCNKCGVSTYEFVCGWCKKVNLIQGRKAWGRRANQYHKLTDLDFCDNVCSGKHSHWLQTRRD